MKFIPKRRKVEKLMSKSVNVFNGRKSLDPITHTESPLEADFCYHLEYDPKIRSYQAQPLSFQYFFEGEMHTYFPDFEVFYDDEDETVSYFEIKYIADIARIENFDAWEKAVAKATNKNGKGFVVLKEDFIRQKPFYENLQTLWAASTIDIDKEFLCYLITMLDERKELSIEELLRNKNSNAEFEQIYRLIFERKLSTPLSKAFLSKQSNVKHSGESYDCYL
jgi:hypothetical protein